MKKLVILGLFALTIISCNAPAKENSENKNDSSNEINTKKVDVKGVKGEELNNKFEIDFDKNAFYSGHYEVYEKDGKEILHGSFELKGNEDMDEFYNRKIKEDPEFEGMDAIVLLGDWSQNTYTGQFKNGKKDGKWTAEMSFYEAGGTATISFDAESGTCTEASYEGGAESLCFKFKGKISPCTFGEIFKHTEEMECE